MKHIGLRWTRVDQGGLEPNPPHTIEKKTKRQTINMVIKFQLFTTNFSYG